MPSFHDGVPVTAHNVKCFFDRIRNTGDGVSPRSGILGCIESIEVPDDHTVVITAKQPTPSLLANFANGWLLVMPKHMLGAGGSLELQIVGSGLFMLKEYRHGRSIELVRKPDFHMPAGLWRHGPGPLG